MTRESITIHSSKDFASMRRAGALAARTLDYIEPFVTPGISTAKLDELCHEFIVSHDAIPAPLHYKGFPKSICTSVNHVVCHGIPSEDKVLQEGDIVNIDVTVILDGWHGDTSRMYGVGQKISVKARRLMEVTYDAMMLGISQVRDGVHISEIGGAIEHHAHLYGFSVVKDFCGHGIGRVFHAAPNVLHYHSKEVDVVLREGMFFTVEPMINTGKHHTKMLADGWTAVTRDKSLSAQWEHTIGITKDGYEIFTLSPGSA